MENGNRIICREVENRYEVVKYFYLQQDLDWHKNTHKRGGTIEENIKETLATIIPDKFYSVYYDGELAAFFSKFENEDGQALDAFHIGIKFRSKDFIIAYWEVVKKQFKGNFATGVLEKNVAAWQHLLKQNLVIQNKIEMNGEKILILAYKS